MKKGLIKSAFRQNAFLIFAAAAISVFTSSDFSSGGSLLQSGYYQIYAMLKKADWYVWILMAVYANIVLFQIRRGKEGELLCSLPVDKSMIWKSYWMAGVLLCGGMYGVLYVLMLLQTAGLGLSPVYLALAMTGRWSLGVLVFTVIWAFAALFSRFFVNILAAGGFFGLLVLLVKGIDKILFGYFGWRGGSSVYAAVSNALFVLRNNMDALSWQTANEPIWNGFYSCRFVIYFGLLLLIAAAVYWFYRQGSRWMGENELTRLSEELQGSIPQKFNYILAVLLVVCFAFLMDLGVLYEERFYRYFDEHPYDYTESFIQLYGTTPEEDPENYHNYIESQKYFYNTGYGTKERQVSFDRRRTIVSYRQNDCLYTASTKLANYPPQPAAFFLVGGIGLGIGAGVTGIYVHYKKKWEEAEKDAEE